MENPKDKTNSTGLVSQKTSVDTSVINDYDKKINELMGGIKNAIERGQSLDSAKRSLINAGYNPRDVGIAIQKVSVSASVPRAIVQPNPNAPPVSNVSDSQKTKQQQVKNIQKTLQTQPTKKKSHKLLVIILIIVSVMILVGAGLIILYWPKIMQMFSE